MALPDDGVMVQMYVFPAAKLPALPVIVASRSRTILPDAWLCDSMNRAQSSASIFSAA